MILGVKILILTVEMKIYLPDCSLLLSFYTNVKKNQITIFFLILLNSMRLFMLNAISWLQNIRKVGVQKLF